MSSAISSKESLSGFHDVLYSAIPSYTAYTSAEIPGASLSSLSSPSSGTGVSYGIITSSSGRVTVTGFPSFPHSSAYSKV